MATKGGERVRALVAGLCVRARKGHQITGAVVTTDFVTLFTRSIS